MEFNVSKIKGKSVLTGKVKILTLGKPEREG
jgi:hypothetical protein